MMFMLNRAELEMMREIYERETGMLDLKEKYEEYYHKIQSE